MGYFDELIGGNIYLTPSLLEYKFFIQKIPDMRIRQVFFGSLVVVLFIGLLSVGCKKSSSSTGSGTFSATVSDTAFTPGDVAGIYVSADQAWSILAYQIKAGDTISFDINIYLPFTVNQPIAPNFSNILYQNAMGEPYYNAIGHTPNLAITVTSVDSVNHNIAGTFSGSLYDENGSGDSVVVTKGKFNTSYSVQ